MPFGLSKAPMTFQPYLDTIKFPINLVMHHLSSIRDKETRIYLYNVHSSLKFEISKNKNSIRFIKVNNFSKMFRYNQVFEKFGHALLVIHQGQGFTHIMYILEKNLKFEKKKCHLVYKRPQRLFNDFQIQSSFR